MTPDEVTAWILPISIIATAFLGFAITVVSIRAGYINAITAYVVSYAIIGGVFLASPKWATLTVEFAGLKAEIAELREENTSLEQERTALVMQTAAYKHEIGELQGAAWRKTSSAGEFVEALATAKQNVDWATFIPSDPSQFKLSVDPSNTIDVQRVAERLGAHPSKLIEAIGDGSITILTPPAPGELNRAPASDLWVSPVNQGASDQKK